jgi:ABC-2 type transport system ATP-binding protein
VDDAAKGVMVETRQPDAFYSRLQSLAAERDWGLQELSSADDNLEAVFSYLVKT